MCYNNKNIFTISESDLAKARTCKGLVFRFRKSYYHQLHTRGSVSEKSELYLLRRRSCLDGCDSPKLQSYRGLEPTCQQYMIELFELCISECEPEQCLTRYHMKDLEDGAIYKAYIVSDSDEEYHFEGLYMGDNR